MVASRPPGAYSEWAQFNSGVLPLQWRCSPLSGRGSSRQRAQWPRHGSSASRCKLRRLRAQCMFYLTLAAPDSSRREMDGTFPPSCALRSTGSSQSALERSSNGANAGLPHAQMRAYGLGIRRVCLTNPTQQTLRCADVSSVCRARRCIARQRCIAHRRCIAEYVAHGDLMGLGHGVCSGPVPRTNCRPPASMGPANPVQSLSRHSSHTREVEASAHHCGYPSEGLSREVTHRNAAVMVVGFSGGAGDGVEIGGSALHDNPRADGAMRSRRKPQERTNAPGSAPASVRTAERR